MLPWKEVLLVRELQYLSIRIFQISLFLFGCFIISFSICFLHYGVSDPAVSRLWRSGCDIQWESSEGFEGEILRPLRFLGSMPLMMNVYSSGLEMAWMRLMDEAWWLG